MDIRAFKIISSSSSDLNALLVRKDASHCSLREKYLQRHRLKDSNQKSLLAGKKSQVHHQDLDWCPFT